MTQPAAPAPADPEKAADAGSEVTRPYARERREGVSAFRGLLFAMLFAAAIVAVAVVVVIVLVNVLG